MTERERKSMMGAALLLAGAALVRFLVAPAPAEAPLGERGSIADSLLAAGDSALEDRERRSRPFEPGETIDPNIAGEVDLDRLPGVGASRARQIVENRNEHGPFLTVEELARVPGIGPASVERLRPHLKVAAAVRAPVRARAAPEGVGGGGAGGVVVDLNRATAEELQSLPGIGPVTAGRIVAWREENGGFRTPDQLMEVSGVGERTFARVAPLVRVDR